MTNQAGVESLGESHELPMRQIMRKNLLGVGVLLASLGSLFPYPTAQETKVSSYQGANDHIMVVIRGGTFIMGSPLDEPGRSDDEVPSGEDSPHLRYCDNRANKPAV